MCFQHRILPHWCTLLIVTLMGLLQMRSIGLKSQHGKEIANQNLSLVKKTDNAKNITTVTRTTENQMIVSGTSEKCTGNMTIQEFWKNRYCVHDMKNEVAFFHVGKGGGGTIELALKVDRIKVTKIHPSPKKSAIESLQKGQTQTMIINIRDPVDRFESVFNWRDLLLCRKNDTRTVKGGTSRDPIHLCQQAAKWVKEEDILRQKYKSNLNLLAESLCEDSPQRYEAVQDFNTMLHKTPLVDWLNFLIEKNERGKFTGNGFNQFITIPMGKTDPDGQSASSLFQQHVDNATALLLAKSHGKDIAEEMIRQKPKPSAKQTYSYQHTSVTNATKPPSLTPLAECCLTRHFEDDYRVILTMLQGADLESNSVLGGGEFPLDPFEDVHPIMYEACNWGDEDNQRLCRETLAFMLLRRVDYLDRSHQTCSQAVASGAE